MSPASAAIHSAPAHTISQSSQSNTPASTPPSSPGPSTASWPDPSAVSLVLTKGLNVSKRHKAARNKTTRFEVALADHLAEFLEGRDGRTIKSIAEATGVQAQLTGEPGRKKFACWGSASAVAKAKSLVDARLSQTPIRIFHSIRLSSELSALSFRRSTIDLPRAPVPSSGDALYMVESIAPLPDFTGFPSPEAASPLPTPGSERSESSGFFSSSSAGSYSRSRLSLLGETRSNTLPSVASFIANRIPYINAIVDELSACVERSSLVKLRLMAGNQLFHPPAQGVGVGGARIGEGSKFSLQEVADWKIDGPQRSFRPSFSVILSRLTAEDLERRLMEELGLSFSGVTSQVHVTLLDKRRAVYMCATSDLKGGEIRNNEGGASGTLLLKKCSTLPSKPFFLSITTPTLDSEPLREGSDLRIKVLADKAATSPSSELSAAVQRASWDLDNCGVFQVHIDLDPQRFSASDTEIHWSARSRYENADFRATICEVRISGSKQRWWELKLTDRKLNSRLADAVQARKGIDRTEIAVLVGRFIEWGLGILRGTEQTPGVQSDDEGTTMGN